MDAALVGTLITALVSVAGALISIVFSRRTLA
jgi:hypothetical protein